MRLIRKLAGVQLMVVLCCGAMARQAFADEASVRDGQIAVQVLEKAPAPGDDQAGPLVYWEEVHTDPRPLRLHFVRIDLTDPRLEVATILDEDPDGDGPAQTTLRSPLPFAKSRDAIVAVNANGFWYPPGSGDNPNKIGWVADKPAIMQGLVVSDGVVRSEHDPKRQVLWIDGNGRARVSIPGAEDSPRQAVASFEGPVLGDGEVTARESRPYPRTIMGIDESGRWLYMLFVVGRQPGVSEGLKLDEAARIMRDRGCHDAINLDGGGSSTMLIEQDGRLQAVGDPPKGYLRPLPLMVAVRRTADTAAE